MCTRSDFFVFSESNGNDDCVERLQPFPSHFDSLSSFIHLCECIFVLFRFIFPVRLRSDRMCAHCLVNALQPTDIKVISANSRMQYKRIIRLMAMAIGIHWNACHSISSFFVFVRSSTSRLPMQCQICCFKWPISFRLRHQVYYLGYMHIEST